MDATLLEYKKVINEDMNTDLYKYYKSEYDAWIRIKQEVEEEIKKLIKDPNAPPSLIERLKEELSRATPRKPKFKILKYEPIHYSEGKCAFDLNTRDQLDKQLTIINNALTCLKNESQPKKKTINKQNLSIYLAILTLSIIILVILYNFFIHKKTIKF
jgi:hypothetical protein